MIGGGDLRHAARSGAGHAGGRDRHRGRVLARRSGLAGPGRLDGSPPRAARGPSRERRTPAAGAGRQPPDPARLLADPARGRARSAPPAPCCRCGCRASAPPASRSAPPSCSPRCSARCWRTPIGRVVDRRGAGLPLVLGLTMTAVLLALLPLPHSVLAAGGAQRDRARRPADRLHDPGHVGDHRVRRAGRDRARGGDDAAQPRLGHGRDDRRPGRRPACRRRPATPCRCVLLAAIMVVTLWPVLRARLTPTASAPDAAPPAAMPERRYRPGRRRAAHSGRHRDERRADYPHLLSPVEVGPADAAQPGRLDLASDRPRPRPPPHRRPARLPRGARPRRRRGDLPRGDRRRPQRPAHRATRIGGFLPEIVPVYRRLADAVARATAPGCSCSCCTAAASRSPARPSRRRWRRRRSPACASSASPGR